jgi:Zn-dependent protease with chaperone function
VEDQPPSPGPVPATVPPTDASIYFDGVSNRRHLVTIRLNDHGLDLIEDGLGTAAWAYSDLRAVSAPAGTLRLACTSSLPLARLEVRDPELQRAIQGRGLQPDRPTTTAAQNGKIVFWSLAAVASLVLVTLYGIPFIAERLTPLVPVAFEQRMGDMTERQVRLIFGGRACAGAQGRVAFDKLVNTLRAAGGLGTTLQSEVLASVIPNAFALPGGKVFLLDGLLQRANSVDEVAGVLAHELGHVSHRDHVRVLIHNGGTSFLVGLLFGDVTGSGAAIFATRAVLESSYSRDAESSADAFAIDVMHRLGRSPKPLGDFLFRITGAQGGSPIGILASHPLTEARREIMSAADRPNTGPELLSAAEWRALKTICK